MKSYPTRDSATALLRKIGVERAAYSRFLTISGPEGAERFDVDDGMARAAVQTIAKATGQTITKLQEMQNPTLRAIAQAGKRLADAPVSVEVRGGRVLRAKTTKPKPTVTEELKLAARLSPKPPRDAAKVLLKASSKPTKPKTTPTVGAKARELILGGKTNAEVWAVLQPLYDLDEGKRYYPGWYRMDLRRKGLLPALHGTV